MKLSRKRGVAIALTVLAIFLVADAFVPPPAHDVHSLGASRVSVSAYQPAISSADRVDFWWQPGPATDSLSDIKCTHIRDPQRPCTAPDVATEFPNLHQTDRTLYYVWTGCIEWSGHGAIIPWDGYNVEYFASSRTLVLHCYIGVGWVYFPERLFGMASLPRYILLAIPTSAMGSGRVSIREDDRLEHLAGDWSTEYDLATATIS